MSENLVVMSYHVMLQCLPPCERNKLLNCDLNDFGEVKRIGARKLTQLKRRAYELQ